MSLSSMIESLWYSKKPSRWVLFPLSLVYLLVSSLRSSYLKKYKQHCFPIPIIVVGNITVGGVGKTPLVVALAKELTAKGIKVGIVSRGYKAQCNHFPHEVSPQDDALWVGDEPLLLAKKTGCPVVIARKRVDAIHYLQNKYAVQMVISDDGLQHYRMGRAIEIIVMDERGMGNGLCLPAGPLREMPHRLKQADFIVFNGNNNTNAYTMRLQKGKLTHLRNQNTIEKENIPSPIAAVAAIGNPQRFFNSLRDWGIHFIPYAFKDHYPFSLNDFTMTEASIVMTEKDAVKCSAFATDNMYYLPVEAHLDDKFWDALWCHKELRSFVNWQSN